MDKIMNTFFNELLPAAKANEDKNVARRQSLFKIATLFTRYKKDKITLGKLHDRVEVEFHRLKDNSDKAFPIVEQLLRELDTMKEYWSRPLSKSINRSRNRNNNSKRNVRSKSIRRNRTVNRNRHGSRRRR